jgi:hypothetical protein
VPDANAPSGSVIQVVNVISNSPTTTNTLNGTVDAVTASITPISTSSKILILARMPFNIVRGGASSGGVAGWAVARILRNGSAIQPNAGQSFEHGVNFGDNVWGDMRHVTFIQSLDSPNTTSSTTYTIQATNYAAQQTLIVNEGSYYYSTITLMEIAG